MQSLKRLFAVFTSNGDAEAAPRYAFAEILNWLFENVRTAEGELLSQEQVVTLIMHHHQAVDSVMLSALRQGVLDENALNFAQLRALAAAFNVSVPFLFCLQHEGTLSEIYHAYGARTKMSLCPHCGAYMVQVRDADPYCLCAHDDEEQRAVFESIKGAIHGQDIGRAKGQLP